MESTGTRIRCIRRAAGLSQVDFSKRICISQSHLSKVECDKMRLSKSAIRLPRLESRVHRLLAEAGLC